MAVMLHISSDIQSNHIGDNTNIWQFCVVLPGAIVGSNCNICSHCFIENDVVIGNNVTLKCGVQIWDGITLEDDVFAGPNVSFTNDRNPVSGNNNFTIERTIIKKGASIGAGAVILPGITNELDYLNKYEAWKKYKFDIIFVGSDWQGTDKWNALEKEFESVCVKVIYFPYTKTTSSTKINNILDTYNE